MSDFDWSLYSFVCDECGTIGTTDDGFNGPGDDCPRAWDDDDPCDGKMRLRGEFYYHEDDDDAPNVGMEYWHDGEFTRKQCHDCVGLVTEHHQPFDEFIAMFPNAEIPLE